MRQIFYETVWTSRKRAQAAVRELQPKGYNGANTRWQILISLKQ